MAKELIQLRTAPPPTCVVGVGSVVVWEVQDPGGRASRETVIITPSGGGPIQNYRLVSAQAPAIKAILGKRAGETVNSGQVTISIKELVWGQAK